MRSARTRVLFQNCDPDLEGMYCLSRVKNLILRFPMAAHPLAHPIKRPFLPSHAPPPLLPHRPISPVTRGTR